MTTEIQKLFQQSVQCFMGRPDYDFSFFLTNDFFAPKKKKKQKTTTKLRGCEMNQLEMTVDESLQGKHSDDHLRFPAIKKSAHGPNTVSYFFFTHMGIYCL